MELLLTLFQATFSHIALFFASSKLCLVLVHRLFPQVEILDVLKNTRLCPSQLVRFACQTDVQIFEQRPCRRSTVCVCVQHAQDEVFQGGRVAVWQWVHVTCANFSVELFLVLCIESRTTQATVSTYKHTHAYTHVSEQSSYATHPTDQMSDLALYGVLSAISGAMNRGVPT